MRSSVQKVLLFLLFPLLIVLTGCDPVFGVSRRARVQFMPAPTRVGAAIKATPGVDNVEYRATEGSRPLTLTGIKPPAQIHTFMYSGGSNVHGVVQFEIDYKQTVWYSQTLLSLGRRPPQEWIDATRPVMKRIESELEKNCGLTNLQESVVEKNFGVK